MSAKYRWLIGAMLAAGAALTSCRNVAGPTPQPTASLTPISTPLPTLPPTPVPGSEDQPIRFVIVHEAGGRAVQNAATALAETLTEATGLALDVALVDSDRDAVEALCAAFDGAPSLAFVSGPGYSAAATLGCADVALLAEDPDAEAVTRDVVVIAPAESGIAALAALGELPFCRLGAADLATWQAPALLLMSNGLTPTTLLSEEVDVPDLDTLIEQVAAGDCAGALFVDDFERIVTEAQQDDITILATVRLPLGMVMAATETPLGARTALFEALRDLARTDDGADLLDTLFGAGGLVAPASDVLEAWDAFIASTGIDFAAF